MWLVNLISILRNKVPVQMCVRTEGLSEENLASYLMTIISPYNFAIRSCIKT